MDKSNDTWQPQKLPGWPQNHPQSVYSFKNPLSEIVIQTERSRGGYVAMTDEGFKDPGE